MKKGKLRQLFFVILLFLLSVNNHILLQKLEVLKMNKEDTETDREERERKERERKKEKREKEKKEEKRERKEREREQEREQEKEEREREQEKEESEGEHEREEREGVQEREEREGVQEREEREGVQEREEREGVQERVQEREVREVRNIMRIEQKFRENKKKREKAILHEVEEMFIKKAIACLDNAKNHLKNFTRELVIIAFGYFSHVLQVLGVRVRERERERERDFLLYMGVVTILKSGFESLIYFGILSVVRGYNRILLVRSLLNIVTSNPVKQRIINYLTEYAFVELLGNRKVLSIDNNNVLNNLIDISNEFWETYENIISFSCVSPGMVDNEKVILALIDPFENGPVYLPRNFQDYKVLIDYGVIEPAHRTRNDKLIPGISIGSISSIGNIHYWINLFNLFSNSNGNNSNGFTLGPLFKTENKQFILTVQHGVRNNNLIIQPGSCDGGTSTDYCANIRYTGITVNEDYLIDYAFCEIDTTRRGVLPNNPLKSGIIIKNVKKNVSNDKAKVTVYKVGRSTYYTNGLVEDQWSKLIFKNIEKKNIKGLIVYHNDNNNKFGDYGDSGSPVFDENGLLWGILQGIHPLGILSVIIPIHVILNHVKKHHNVDFILI